MEPPQPPPPPPASPFDPAARPRPGGCPKPLIIGCVAVLLIGGLALLAGIFFVAKNASTVLQWSVNKMEEGVLKELPSDVTQDERDRLRQAFADVSEGLKSGRIPPDKFQPVQFKILEIVQKKNKVTRQDVQELTELLERTAGKGGTESGGSAGPP
ncbi:MAG TPA: hypothetical protein VHC97_18820 [Thermoanaerobaculia bacterium]|jgi:hypothetical protein|nr:hypothetical protein [Thermoanaerobaculia bacterium]